MASGVLKRDMNCVAWLRPTGDGLCRRRGAHAQKRAPLAARCAPLAALRFALLTRLSPLSSSLPLHQTVTITPGLADDGAGEGPAAAPQQQPQHPQYAFRFDALLHGADQEAVYDAVAPEIVQGALDGFNGAILCYGQTGARRCCLLLFLFELERLKKGSCTYDIIVSMRRG